ncbi:MAG: hypothetical protein ACI31M_02810 [Bacilli bacterium]
MKIEKFIKLKDNRYKVIFNTDDIITLYDDVIVKYNLLSNREMDNKKFKEIGDYNDSLEAYYKAVKYINRKLRSKKEIINYLSKDYDNVVVKSTVDKLEKDGYLNESLFISAYISDQLNLTLNGYYKIEKDLINLGLDENSIHDVLDKIDDSIWEERIDKLIDKKVKANHVNSYRKLKDKIIYDLGNMGYRKEDVIKIYTTKEIVVDKDIIIKEGNKIYNKLSKKYKDQELIYYLRNKLYQKGFSSEEISEYIDKKNTE